VAPWQDWTPEFWDWFAVRAGLTLPNWLVAPLNFAALLVLVAIGVGLFARGNGERVILRYPMVQLLAGMGLMAVIAYILLGGQSQSSGPEDIPSGIGFVILLAAAAVSFPIAGGGNLMKQLWFMLGGVGILLTLNEVTKFVMRAMQP